MQKNIIFFTSTAFWFRDCHGNFAVYGRFLSIASLKILKFTYGGRLPKQTLANPFLSAIATRIFIAPKGYGGFGTRLDPISSKYIKTVVSF